MATVTVTTSPVTLDTGSAGFIRITNTGVVQARVTRDGDSILLWPNSATVITPGGVPVAAVTISGTTTLETATGTLDAGMTGSGAVAFDDLSAGAVAGVVAAGGATFAPSLQGTLSGDAGRPGVKILLPQDFGVGASTPTLGLLSGRCFGWTIRSNSADRINTVITRPQHDLVDIDVIWVNLGATTGSVNWRLYRCANRVGDSPASSLVQIGPTVCPSLGQNQFQRSRIATALDMSSDMFTTLMLDRPKDANDTLAQDVAVVAVVITPIPLTTASQRIATHDGAQCWFNEPRAICSNSNIFTSWVNRTGGVGITKVTSDGVSSDFTLRTFLEQDDHDTPGLLVRNDDKIMAFYTRHSVVDDPIYYRTSTSAGGNITAWGSETSITLPAGSQPCYPKPFQLSTGRIYVIFRNLTNQDFIYSDDNGATWSAPATLFQWSTGWRGYVNLVQTNDRIDVLSNDDNPNVGSDTNLYHCYILGGNVYKTDGTLISALGVAIQTSQLTKIYDRSVDGDAWGWDIQLDSSGNPVCVFATFPGSSTASTSDTDHHYYYARWTGTWTYTKFAKAGPTIVDSGGEYRYSGGIALLSSNTSVVYTSRYISPQWEIERWVTADGGATWTSTQVTRRSWEKQIRPTTPEKHTAGLPEVLWMSGWYTQFLVFGTRLMYRPAQ